MGDSHAASWLCTAECQTPLMPTAGEPAAGALATANQHQLSRLYDGVAATLEVGSAPSLLREVWVSAASPLLDVVLPPVHGTVDARARTSVRAASALHALARLKVGYKPASFWVTLPTGTGKTSAVVAAAWQVARALRSPLDDPMSNEDPVTLAQLAALADRSPTLDRLLQQFRDSFRLTRASMRDLRKVLLALVGLRALTFTKHRARLDAVESKGQVYLRKALRGSSTRNAPPLATVVRRLGTTGTLCSPPMQLTP